MSGVVFLINTIYTIFMKLKPLGTNVLVEKLGSEEKTVSGIIIPKEKENNNNIGVVVVVGEGRMLDGVMEKPSAKEGDKIIYSWGEKVEFEGKEYDIVSESSVLAIVQN